MARYPRAMILQICVRALRSALQDLKRDIKTTRWLRGLGWTVGVIWFLGLAASGVFISIMPAFTSDDTACPPDGEFTLYPDRYSMWSWNGFFQITLGGGELSFGQAKVVDIVWDIGVGRGGQLVLAIISWREFARYLTICMESEPVTYQVFRTIFVENDASVLSTYRTIKSFIWQRRLRSNVAMIFMTATMIFILAFPTLVSALSGYDSNVASRIQDLDDNLVPFNDFSRLFYAIHDAHRLFKNRTEEDGSYWITDRQYGDDPVLGTTSTSCTKYGGRRFNSADCNMTQSVVMYIEAYGLNGKRNESSQFHDFNTREDVPIDPPVLNISAYAGKDERLPGYNLPGALDIMWVRDNELWNYSYISTHGKCQNTDNYQWGFSFLQLFICILLLLAWTIGIYVMWIYTHYTLAMSNRLSDEISGECRAVLELAAAMQTELDMQDIDPAILREKPLKSRIDKELRGGAVAYSHPDSTPKVHSIRNGLKRWFKTEKWWFLAIFITSVFTSTVWMFKANSHTPAIAPAIIALALLALAAPVNSAGAEVEGVVALPPAGGTTADGTEGTDGTGTGGAGAVSMIRPPVVA
ncbi:hypothetical protein OPT61_g9216 [Boeremia exigua]|uniref:Uncharacterized protein n=1 Tax=Boeremia exigua TaxID=749465 RepID=A0ACC2HVN1_9PLEO|nr:hypothetical protein OPT61_g9216 [Boeremia exigua]